MAQTHFVLNAQTPVDLTRSDGAALDLWKNNPLVAEHAEHIRSSLKYTSTPAVLVGASFGSCSRLVWSQLDFEHVCLAWSHPDLVAGTFVPLSARIHVLCAEGWLISRRSPDVIGSSGLWQPAIAEALEAEDLCTSMFDPSLCGIRGCEEELGISPDPSAFSFAGFTISHVGNPSSTQVIDAEDGQHLDEMRVDLVGVRSVNVSIICDVRGLSFADIVAAAETAPDAWESDGYAIRGVKSLCSIDDDRMQEVSSWWP